MQLLVSLWWGGGQTVSLVTFCVEVQLVAWQWAFLNRFLIVWLVWMVLDLWRAFATQADVALERRFLELLQNECGHQHPVLRHLAKVIEEMSQRARHEDGFSAVAINAVAASNLQLLESFSRESFVSKDGLSLAVCQSLGLWLVRNCFLTELRIPAVSQKIFSQQLQWAEQYLDKYPHRKLLWSPLGVVVLCWKHRKGQTRLITTEKQAHFLLALDEASGSGSLEMNGLALRVSEQSVGYPNSGSDNVSTSGDLPEVLQLLGINKPLELLEGNRLAFRDESDASHLDLRVSSSRTFAKDRISPSCLKEIEGDVLKRPCNQLGKQ